jgi:hypothetical protein
LAYTLKPPLDSGVKIDAMIGTWMLWWTFLLFHSLELLSSIIIFFQENGGKGPPSHQFSKRHRKKMSQTWRSNTDHHNLSDQLVELEQSNGRACPLLTELPVRQPRPSTSLQCSTTTTVAGAPTEYVSTPTATCRVDASRLRLRRPESMNQLLRNSILAERWALALAGTSLLTPPYLFFFLKKMFYASFSWTPWRKETKVPAELDAPFLPPPSSSTRWSKHLRWDCWKL